MGSINSINKSGNTSVKIAIISSGETTDALLLNLKLTCLINHWIQNGIGIDQKKLLLKSISSMDDLYLAAPKLNPILLHGLKYKVMNTEQIIKN